MGRKKTKISTPKLTKKKMGDKKSKRKKKKDKKYRKEKKEKKERKLKEKREKKEKKEKEKRQKREKLKREKKEKRKLKNRKISDSNKYDEAHNFGVHSMSQNMEDLDSKNKNRPFRKKSESQKK